MNKKTLFISDLHLDELHTQTTAWFLQFLSQLDASVDALYILGDFFNVWIGDDDVSPFHSAIQAALKKASCQCPIYFLPGNRDFLIGRQFAKQTGCTLLKDPTLIELYGVPTVILHGDLLCKKDVVHLRFRAIAQHFWVKYLFLKLPLAVRKKIAFKLRQRSRLHLTQVFSDAWEIRAIDVQEMMQKYGATQIIHGHTHSHKLYSVNLGQRQGQHIILGDWEQSGSVLICKPNLKKTEVSISDNTLVYFPEQNNDELCHVSS